MKSYRELLVWQKAMDLVVESYRIASLLPKAELYGLRSQIQRAAVSIPANIAEGHGREHLGDYLHHLSAATGSLMELETHFLITEKLSFLAAPTWLLRCNFLPKWAACLPASLEVSAGGR